MLSYTDIAHYILRFRSCPKMTLNYLLYLCQAYHLMWENEPLFKEDFMDVGYGDDPLSEGSGHLVYLKELCTTDFSNLNLTSEDFPNNKELTSVQENNIIRVLTFLQKYNAIDLRDQVCGEWLEHSNKEAIKKHYSELE